MPRDRKPTLRRGDAGDAKGYAPIVKADALTVLVDAARKDTPIKTERARSPRNRDGQSTSYAGFGDQYFRLKSSLVRETNVMAKSGDRLVYPERTLEDKARARDAQAAAAVVAGLASWLPEPGQRVRHNYKMRHSHRVEPCPNGKAPRGRKV